ncbi:MAG: PQQ-binding-like beta-propeller repeat protein [Bacteroidales bacterium]|nr:PQQ-binding-like beta-propeller repeat protein [Bacteroidales bacterium]
MVTFLKQHGNRYRLLLIVLVCLSCLCRCNCKEKPRPIDRLDSTFFYPTDLSVVWIRPYHSDTSFDGRGTPLFVGDYVIFVNNSGIYPKNSGFGVYDKKTGEKHPAWQGEVGEQLGEWDKLTMAHLAGVHNELLIVSSHFKTYAFDINSGTKIWTKYLNYTQLVTSVNFGDYYLVYEPDVKTNIVVRLDAYTGNRTDYFSHVYQNDTYKMISINPPSAYIDKSGDTLLCSITSDWDSHEPDGRVWAYCYNTTQKRMQWVNKNFTDERDACGNIPPPILYDHDKWIVQTLRGLHSLDANTGELIWKKLYWTSYFFKDSIGGGAELFSETPVTLWQDKLYMRSIYGNVYCIDARTGQEIWRNTSICATTNGIAGELPIYQGRLYVAGVGSDETGYIFYGLTCLDAYTGRELWRDEGPVGQVWAPIAIDQETGYLYAGSCQYIMCIDLNKTEENMLKKQ